MLIGGGIGVSDTSRESDLEDELADAEGERDEAEDDLEDAEDELAEIQSALSRARSEARSAEAQARRARNRAAAAQEVAAPEPEPAEQAEADGTYTVGDFTFSDVQVNEDGVGDFEIRARVTNNGDAAEFVDMRATIFDQGSVVADLGAIEDFDAGQTRTVTLIGTDRFGSWDDLEFTVDVGF